MKRILPPIFMLMVVVVIAFATPIDAQKEQQQVEPITTTLHTEKAFEANLAAEPKAAAVDDGLLTSPSGLDAEDLHLRHNLIGLEQAFIDAESEHGRTSSLLSQHWKVVGGAINSAQIILWASGKKSSQVWRSALTQSPHISPNIISVPMANIITAKLLKGSAFGITETPSGQK